jgi:hypothetical protein
MNRTYQFKTIDTAPALAPELPSATTVSRTQRLIDDLHRNIAALEADIAAEQQRCGIHDPTDIAYPWVAKAWAERSRNLKITVKDLEAAIARQREESVAR